MRTQILIPLPENTGERLDRYLSEKLNVARSQIQNWIDCGLVKVSGEPRAKNYRLRAGDAVEVTIQPAPAERRRQSGDYCMRTAICWLSTSRRYGSASAAGNRRHAGQRAARPLRGNLSDIGGNPAALSPAGQGHQRPAGGRQKQRGAPNLAAQIKATALRGFTRR